MQLTGDNPALRRAPSGEPPRVLVVDDEPLVRRWVERVLQEAGYAVDTAVDGLAAVSELARTRYEMVLTDVTMPRLDGVGVLAAAAQQDPTLPVVLMTGAPSEDLLTRATPLGVAQILGKPMSMESVVETVGRWVRLRRAHGLASSLHAHGVVDGGARVSKVAAHTSIVEVTPADEVLCLSELQVVGPAARPAQVLVMDVDHSGWDAASPQLAHACELARLCTELRIRLVARDVASSAVAAALRQAGCELLPAD